MKLILILSNPRLQNEKLKHIHGAVSHLPNKDAAYAIKYRGNKSPTSDKTKTRSCLPTHVLTREQLSVDKYNHIQANVFVTNKAFID